LAKLTPAACRAARGLLDWSAEKLAEDSGVDVLTVRGFEEGRIHGLLASIERRIVDTFARHGVEITNGQFTGARRSLRAVRIDELHRARAEMRGQIARGQHNRASPVLLEHGHKDLDDIDARLAALEAESRGDSLGDR
jgi:hypothetical protein